MTHPATAHRPRAGKASATYAALAIVTLGGCSCLSGPAGFWKGYHSRCIIESSSDQGPWGGTRLLRWSACDSVHFSRNDVRVFAESHGWKLLDELDVGAAALEVETGDTYPRFMKLPSTVMRFDSGWIREEPGSGRTSTAIGYVQVAHDGSSLYVFHFWGNG